MVKAGLYGRQLFKFHKHYTLLIQCCNRACTMVVQINAVFILQVFYFKK